MVVRSKVETDQVMVVEFNQTIGTKRNIVKPRMLDFHIGIVSSFSIISKNDENPNILIEVMFI